MKTLSRAYILIVVSLFVLLPVHLEAQSSLVPLIHSVYDWLHQQRVDGRVTGYHIELAPYSRADIAGFLNIIATSDRPLSRLDAMTLRSYQREFDAELLRKSSIRRSWESREGYKEKAIGIWRDQPEPYAYRYATPGKELEGYVYLMRGRAIVDVYEDSNWLWSHYYFKGIRGFLNSGDGLGLHAEIDNVFALGNYEILKYDSAWGTSFPVTEQPENQSSYSYEVFAGYHQKYWSLDIGRGSLEFGPSVSDAIVLRRDAPNFNWVRLIVGTPRFNFLYMHGSLRSYSQFSEIDVNGRPTIVRTAPPRRMAMHRLTFEPFHWLTFGIHEFVVYANRSSDLTYLNPLVPFLFAEMDEGDMDSNMLGGDIRIRPFRGTELFSSLFIDDLYDFPSLIDGSRSKVALNAGFHQNLPFATQLSGSYTRIDALMYTHYMWLNTYENAGQPLGHRLGPNAEEWALRLSAWLPFRSRAVAGISFAKKGMNPLDEEGNATENVGGDLFWGAGEFIPIFEGADMHHLFTWNVSLSTELLRGLRVSLDVSNQKVRKGSQLKPLQIVDFRFGFGF